MEEVHNFIPSKNKKECEICRKIYSECMKSVDLFVIEGPKARDFYGKSEKARHVTDLYTYELVETIKGLDRNLKVMQIESTATSSFLLNAFGDLYTWGENDEADEDGRLYLGPKKIPTMKGIKIVAVACGEMHVLALESDMYVWAWGDNTYGQLGKTEYKEPERILNINTIVRIAAGPYSSFAVNSKSIVYAWGKNDNMCLGITGPEVIDRASELDICPWNSEANQKHKVYFKYQTPREVKISGASRSEIRAKQAENEDLHSRIMLLSKKVDFLEDETLTQGGKRLAKEWDKDAELKEIIKLKDKITINNNRIRNEEKSIISEIEKFEEDLKKIDSSFKLKEQEIIDELRSIEEVEQNIKEYMEKNVTLLAKGGDQVKEELAKNESNITRRKNDRRDKHAKVIYAELEKERLMKQMDEIKNMIEEKKAEIKEKIDKFDKFTQIYQEMESVKKRQLSEKIILQVTSRTYQEIEDIMAINQAILSSSVKSLGKEIGKYSHPEEIISISNKLLDVLMNVVSEKFKRSGFSYVGKTIIIWAVIAENIKMQQYLNKLRSTITAKLLELSKKSLEDWDQEEEIIKQKIVNEILVRANIDETIPFDDLSKVIEEKKKKRLLRKFEEGKNKKGSSWRSCF